MIWRKGGYNHLLLVAYPEGHDKNNETLHTVFSQQIINLSLEVYAAPCKIYSQPQQFQKDQKCFSEE